MTTTITIVIIIFTNITDNNYFFSITFGIFYYSYYLLFKTIIHILNILNSYLYFSQYCILLKYILYKKYRNYLKDFFFLRCKEKTLS